MRKPKIEIEINGFEHMENGFGGTMHIEVDAEAPTALHMLAEAAASVAQSMHRVDPRIPVESVILSLTKKTLEIAARGTQGDKIDMSFPIQQ